MAAVGSIRSSPPEKPTIPLRASSSRSSQASIRPSRPSASGGAGATWFVGEAREAAFPVFRSAERFAGDFDAKRPAFTDSGNAPRKEECFAPSFYSHARRDRDQLRVDNGAGGRDALASHPRLDDLAIVDQRRAGLTNAALDDPFRQWGSPRSSAVSAFRRAAGRRRSNSCPRCAGHRPRHSPGAHSRRPCRAIRRGSHNGRSLRR